MSLDTTGARLSFDGFSRWSRCEPRNVVALRYHLVTTRPPPGGGGWLHSEGEWGRAAGQIDRVIGGIVFDILHLQKGRLSASAVRVWAFHILQVERLDV